MIIALIGPHTGRHIYPYDIVFFILAGVIVYPDKILTWISGKTGKILGWWHYLVTELLAIGSIIIATVLFLPVYSQVKRWPLKWWEPLLWIGFLAAVRIGVWLVAQLFNFDA